MVIPYRRFKKPSLLTKLFKLGIIVATLIAVIAALLIFFVNGNNIKAPLSAWLSENLGTEFTVETLEFSPLYPNTVKLINPKVGTLAADEIYLEFDIQKSLTDKALKLNDLYIKNFRYDKEDLSKLLSRKFNFNDISVDELRIDGVQIDFNKLKAQDSKLRLYQVNLKEDGKLTVDNGKINLNRGSFETLNFKNLNFDFKYEGNTLNLLRLQTDLLGGNISGNGIFDLKENAFNFTDLNFNKVLLKTGNSFYKNLKLNALTLRLNDCFYINQDNDITLSGISGEASYFSFNEGKINAHYLGNIDEISFPKHKITLSDTKLNATINDEDINANLSGSIFEGTTALNFTFLSKNKHLIINKLNLEKNKIYFNDNLASTAVTLSKNVELTFESVNFKDLSFISSQENLPLNILSLSGNADNINVTQGKFNNQNAGVINITASDLTYSDLLVSKLQLISTVSPDLLSLSIPDIKFRNSSLSLSGTLALKEGPSFLLLQGRNFNLADLNSNLSRRLLSGNADIEINLKSLGSPEDLSNNLDGSFYIKSDNILISNLGLDFINGGNLKTQNLSLPDLETALYDTDCGIYKFDFNGKITKGELKAHSTFSLNSADVSGDIKLNLNSKILNGNFLFNNDLEGNKTRLILFDKLPNIKFKLIPLIRNTARPGIVLFKDEKDTVKD